MVNNVEMGKQRYFVIFFCIIYYLKFMLQCAWTLYSRGIKGWFWKPNSVSFWYLTLVVMWIFFCRCHSILFQSKIWCFLHPSQSVWLLYFPLSSLVHSRCSFTLMIWTIRNFSDLFYLIIIIIIIIIILFLQW